MSSKDASKVATALERILHELSPVAPPPETIEAIKAIGREYHLSRDEIGGLVDAFLDYHEIDPEEAPPVAILRSGYQVLGQVDGGELLDDLVNSIIGDTLVALNEFPPGSWEKWFDRRAQELVQEVDHVVTTMHVDLVRTLFREALGRLVWDNSDRLFEEAFPHLKAGLAIKQFVNALKQEGVLILGKDSDEGFELLQRISHLLETEHSKAPLLLKEQEDHDDLGLVAKLLINSAAARWVLVENSYPSGHLYELPFVDMVGVVVVVLQQEGVGASFMPGESILKNAQWQRFSYACDELETVLADAVQWAERAVATASRAHRRARPWTPADQEVVDERPRDLS